MNTSTTSSASKPDPSTPGKSILLVEDEPGMRDILSQMLQSEGYTVLALPNGEEAMAYARKKNAGKIDLLIADLVMPKVGGLELASWFHENFPTAKILIISGYTNEMVIFEEKLAATTSFLPKPLYSSAFKSKVAELLS